MAFAEQGSVLSIGSFMALIGGRSQFLGDGLVGDIYRLSGLEDPYSFLFSTGVGVLVALSIATFVFMFTTWRLAMHAQKSRSRVQSLPEQPLHAPTLAVPCQWLRQSAYQ